MGERAGGTGRWAGRWVEKTSVFCGHHQQASTSPSQLSWGPFKFPCWFRILFCSSASSKCGNGQNPSFIGKPQTSCQVWPCARGKHPTTDLFWWFLNEPSKGPSGESGPGRIPPVRASRRRTSRLQSTSNFEPEAAKSDGQGSPAPVNTSAIRRFNPRYINQLSVGRLPPEWLSLSQNGCERSQLYALPRPKKAQTIRSKSLHLEFLRFGLSRFGIWNI